MSYKTRRLKNYAVAAVRASTSRVASGVASPSHASHTPISRESSPQTTRLVLPLSTPRTTPDPVSRNNDAHEYSVACLPADVSHTQTAGGDHKEEEVHIYWPANHCTPDLTKDVLAKCQEARKRLDCVLPTDAMSAKQKKQVRTRLCTLRTII